MTIFSEFVITTDEQTVYRKLVHRWRPARIAEFGSGNTTRFWAEESSAQITSWDNTEAWLDRIRADVAAAPWKQRVHFILYDVAPAGDRSVSKLPVPYDGPAFDMVFVDGPRSAHPTSFGRSGSFLFACQHVRTGGLIVWHDNDRRYERALALRYCGHCLFGIHGRVGWCKWRPLNETPLFSRVLCRLVNRIHSVFRPAKG